VCIRSHFLLSGAELLRLRLEDGRHLLLFRHGIAELHHSFGRSLGRCFGSRLLARRVFGVDGHLARDVSGGASPSGDLGRHPPGHDGGGPLDDGGVIIVLCGGG